MTEAIVLLVLFVLFSGLAVWFGHKIDTERTND